jgi:hypothetical protein
MVADQALFLLFTHRFAAFFLVRGSPLQNEICQLQQVVGDGDYGDGAGSFGIAFAGNAPERNHGFPSLVWLVLLRPALRLFPGHRALQEPRCFSLGNWAGSGSHFGQNRGGVFIHRRQTAQKLPLLDIAGIDDFLSNLLVERQDLFSRNSRWATLNRIISR